jgi:hypothetical protein
MTITPRPVLVWLLDINVGGRILRLSSRPVVVESDRYGSLPYDGGLDDIEIDDSLPGPGRGADERSAQIDVVIGSDLSALVAAGLDLSTCRASLALWREGVSHERRDERLAGRLVLPASGEAGEVLSFTLSDDAGDDTARVVPAEAVVDSESWPTHRNDARGASYPWPWGTPGVLVDESGAVSVFPGSPCLPVETSGGDGENAATLVDTLLVADGRVSATSVTLWRDDPDSGRLVKAATSVSLTTMKDGRGRLVTVIDSSGFAAASRESSRFYLSWDQGGAGVYSTWSPNAITTLGDLLRTLARKSDVRFDLGSWAALADLLPWECSGFVADDVSPYDLILDLIEHTPVALLSRLGGLAPALWDVEARRVDAVESLVEGEGVYRVARPQTVNRPDRLATQIRVAYGLDAELDETVGRRVLAPTSPRGAHESSSVYVRTSAMRDPMLDEVRESSVEAPWATRRSAGRLMHWLARQRATSPVTISLDVERHRCLHLEPGSVVLYTDSGLALDRRVALVSKRVESARPAWRVVLTVLDDVASGLYPEPGGVSPDEPTFDPSGP